MSCLGTLGLEFQKTIVTFEFNTLKFVKSRNFIKKWKCLNLEPKIPDFGVFWLEFQKFIVTFEISTLKFVKLRNFVKKWKCLNLGPKMYLGYFGGRVLKICSYIWNQLPRYYQIEKFREKINMPKFGTENAWFGCVWTKISKHSCHIWNQHPQICEIAKFFEKIKKPKFGTKNNWFGHFGVKFQKTIAIFEFSTLIFVLSESLTNQWFSYRVRFF